MILIFRISDGKPIKTVTTLKEASEATGCDMGNISNIIKGAIDQSKGYTFVKTDGTLSRILCSTLVDDYFRIRENSLKDYICKKQSGNYV